MTQWGLDTIFNPAKRHMDEEKRRLQSTREEVGDNSGGKRINLESGKVRIAAATEEDGADGAQPGHRESDVADKTAAKTADKAPVKTADKARDKGRAAKPASEPTAAQIRAAARRGRTLT
jgi:Family of unknown function (DUF6191)